MTLRWDTLAVTINEQFYSIIVSQNGYWRHDGLNYQQLNCLGLAYRPIAGGSKLGVFPMSFITHDNWLFGSSGGYQDNVIYRSYSGENGGCTNSESIMSRAVQLDPIVDLDTLFTPPFRAVIQ
jgi:hypothetical protein